MKKTYRILPVYTGDVSGAASALYELGGMTVIHDPSGCNSTYNTHDETRWFDQESLIYISGLNDIDAITGNDEKFINDICYAAEKMKPLFIALANSPLPYLNGTDFKGICKVLEEKTGLPCFYVNTNAMHDYSKGQSEAFLSFAKRMLKEPGKKITNGVNIIGMTPLDYTSTNIYISDGHELVSNWALNTSYEEVVKAPQAELNLIGYLGMQIHGGEVRHSLRQGAPVERHGPGLHGRREKSFEELYCRRARYLRLGRRISQDGNR